MFVEQNLEREIPPCSLGKLRLGPREAADAKKVHRHRYSVTPRLGPSVAQAPAARTHKPRGGGYHGKPDMATVCGLTQAVFIT